MLPSAFLLLLACQPTASTCTSDVVAVSRAYQIHLDDEQFVFAGLDGVRTCPKNDCTQAKTLLPYASGARVVVDSGFVYRTRRLYDGPGSIDRCALTGCDSGPTLIVAEGVTTDAVVENGFVYFGSKTPTGFEIQRCPGTGCGAAPTTVATSSTYVTSIASNGTTLFWTASDALLYACPLEACSSPTALGPGSASIVAVDDTHVYMLTAVYKAANVRRCTLGGCPSPEVVLNADSSLVFAVDGANLYYETFPPPTATPIRRMSKQLGAATDVTSGPTPVRSNLAFDAHCIYWGDGDTIHRAPK